MVKELLLLGQNVHSRVGVGSCSQAEEGAGRDPNPHLPRQKQKLEAHWGGTPPPAPAVCPNLAFLQSRGTAADVHWAPSNDKEKRL